MMSEADKVLERISKSVAESVLGVSDSREEAESSGLCQTGVLQTVQDEESSSDGEKFGSPSEIRRLSFENLIVKDPRYKSKMPDEQKTGVLSDSALQQLITALNKIAQPQQRRFDVRDVKDIVVQFDPDLPTTPTAEQWLESIIKAASLYGGDDEWKLQCAILNLQGAAKLWFSGVIVKTWAEFKTALVRDFPTSVDAVSIHQAMINRKKLPQESLETYFYSHVAMGRKGKLPDEAIVKYIVLGLEGKHGTISPADSLPDLLKKLKWLAELKELKTTNSNPQSSNTRIVKTMGTPNANIKCYRCNGEGHVAASCPEKSAGKSHANFECYRCNQKGHIAKNCGKTGSKQYPR